MSLSVDIVIIVRNKSHKMQGLVLVIVIKSRVKREISWATVLMLPLASGGILSNPRASISHKSVR